jgi:hypothetical protein
VYDTRQAGIADLTVQGIVGPGETPAGTTLGQVLRGQPGGPADAAVVRGERGAAIILGAGFFGVNLNSLNSAQWQTYQHQRGSILLHELLHVYAADFTDRFILNEWAKYIFASGEAPASGGSHWISVWIENDCRPVKPSDFW